MGPSPPLHLRYNTRKERLELVGQVASELAHSLNNSLNSMQLRLSLLREETQTPELTNQVDNLSRIVSETASKIGILQEFIARGITPVEPVDLCPVLEAAAGTIRDAYSSTRDDIPVRLELPSRLPAVRGVHHDLIALFLVLFYYLVSSDPAGQPALMVMAKPGPERVTIELVQRSTSSRAAVLKRAFDPFAALAESPLAVSLIAMQSRIKQYGGSISFTERSDGYPGLLVDLVCASAPPR